MAPTLHLLRTHKLTRTRFSERILRAPGAEVTGPGGHGASEGSGEKDDHDGSRPPSPGWQNPPACHRAGGRPRGRDVALSHESAGALTAGVTATTELTALQKGDMDLRQEAGSGNGTVLAEATATCLRGGVLRGGTGRGGRCVSPRRQDPRKQKSPAKGPTKAMRLNP